MQSMTGFAQSSAGDRTWTVRSVNGKGFDVRIKGVSDALEAQVRDILRERFARGSFSVMLACDEGKTALSLNKDWLDELCREAGRLAQAYPSLTAGSVAELMRVDGVVTAGDSAADEAALKDAFAQAAEELLKSRLAEGEKMKACLTAILDEIESLVKRAREQAENQPEKIREILTSQMARYKDTVDLDAERFAQEVTAFMLRADVQEEIDRLTAHIQTARELFEQTGPVGKKLDFLCQEFNRETNTLCSKSADVGLTRTGMALKSVIDRLREQVQNIE